MSSEYTKHTFDSVVSKQLSPTTMKLNGTNYLLWAQSFSHLPRFAEKVEASYDPQAKSTTTYVDWVANEGSVMT